MRWDHRLDVINGAAADADPITAPQSVNQDHLFRLNEREPASDAVSKRLIVGLYGLAAESITFEIWARDSEDDDPDVKPADQRWILVMPSTVLGGGDTVQTLPTTAAQGFVGGGTFYFRVTAEAVAADRVALFRATS